MSAGAPEEVEHRAGQVDPDTFGNPDFCTPEDPVADFGLSQLPAVSEPPSDGDLPFGPKTVSLVLSQGPILPIGQSIGFWLHSQNYVGHTPLNWILRNRIQPVDSAGQAGGVVARGRWRVRRINAANEVKLFLRPPPIPGFYRYDIEIADFDGKLLASYGKHLRVERRFWKARLGLDDNEFHPGEQVLSRVENLGTTTVLFGAEFSIQRHKGGRWAGIRHPEGGLWLAWLRGMDSGLAGSCSSLRLPRDFPAGDYRIVKEVGPPPWPNGKRSYYLTAPFEVVD